MDDPCYFDAPPVQLPDNPTIASKEEWDFASKKLAELKRAKKLESGYKLSRKEFPELQHSFFLFGDSLSGTEQLVCVANHYYLRKNNSQKIKVAEDAAGIKYALCSVNLGANFPSEDLYRLGYLHTEGIR